MNCDVGNSLEQFSLWAFFLNDWNWVYIILAGTVAKVAVH